MFAPIAQMLAVWSADAGLPADLPWGQPKIFGQGDVALPCFAYAKSIGVSPADAAQQAAAALGRVSHPLCARVSADGPYVNVSFHSGYVANMVIQDICMRGVEYGHTSYGEGKSVLIEYPSQNTHKEFHIGHLRNVCIGNAVVHMYRAAGYSVIPVNYINDFGAHVSKCLWGIVHLYGGVVPETDVQRWLGEVYAKTTEYVNAHEDVKQELQQVLVRLEARDPSIWPLFVSTQQASLAGFARIMNELGVRHSREFLESEVKERGQQKVDELLSKDIAQVGEGGAIIADLSTYGLDIALLRKSSGAGLYMTSDLALAEVKFTEFPVSESINITGTEQNMYFKQLFKVLELSGFTHTMTHIGYGLVNLPEGKMSSRAGNVILYETLRDTVYESMRTEVAKRHEDWSPERVAQNAHILTQAVLKFTMQKHEAAKNITFHMDEAVSFEGYSAPYILYTMARMNSLLRKGGYVEHEDVSGMSAYLNTSEDKALALTLSAYADMLEKARAAYNPSPLCMYAYDVAKAFTGLYSAHTILDAASPVATRARLSLVYAARTVLQNVLTTLTIPWVEEM
jgi:arginyl-tRNA synthetase